MDKWADLATTSDAPGSPLSRRALLRRTFLIGLASTTASLVAACGIAAPTALTTAIAVPRGTPATPATAATPGGTPSPGATRTGVTDTEIKLGTWGPQDGPAGAYGIVSRTIAAYFAQLNTTGGIAGRRIAVINENDSYQPARTVDAVRKLIETDQVFALVGGLGAQHNLDVLDYLVARNVPHIAPATGLGALARPTRPSIFCVQPSYTIEATLLTRHALDALGARKLAIFFQNDPAGREGHDAIQAEMARRGAGAATSVSYLATDLNSSAQALRLQGSGADALILYAVPQAGGSLIQEFGKLDFKPKLLASSLIVDPSLFDLAGPGIDGLIVGSWFPDPADTANPKVAEFRAWMQRNLPDSPIDPFSATGYTYATIMAELLRRTGADLTRERFVRVANGLQGYTGSLIPTLSYTPDDHQGARALAFLQAESSTKTFTRVTDFIELK